MPDPVELEMAQTDLEINRNIRRVLVRHWVDLGRLRMSCANGRICIRGVLLKIPGQGSTALAPANVDTIFQDLKRIQNVKWVSGELENWTDGTGSWLPVGQQKGSQEAGNDESSASSFDLSKDT